MRYRGRFAPSPTGPLHFGSLVAAVASYLDARAHGGEWLVRMEDVDTPRCVKGADTVILGTLAAFGFEWDGPVMYQSERTEAYRFALDALHGSGAAYACTCSRKDAGPGVYPGTCRDRQVSGGAAWRVCVNAEPIAFIDRRLGEYAQDLARDVGDFVVLRADGWFAYQLAVVVDDAEQGITDVVRGADLLDSTPRQIWLQRLLGYAHPRYLHVPVATSNAGEKLSKQTRAPALDVARASAELLQALRFLNIEPENTSASESPKTVLAEAVKLWKLD